jgi:thiamine pyrophosphate-dependent acetolactate synthase large subunit-like protein
MRPNTTRTSKAHLPVVGDIKDALTRLNQMIAKRPATRSTPVARADRRVEKEGPVPVHHQAEIANIPTT